MWLLGLAGALVLGYFIPEQISSPCGTGTVEPDGRSADTTDMLSIVLGAGLSLDQAIRASARRSVLCIRNWR